MHTYVSASTTIEFWGVSWSGYRLFGDRFPEARQVVASEEGAGPFQGGLKSCPLGTLDYYLLEMLAAAKKEILPQQLFKRLSFMTFTCVLVIVMMTREAWLCSSCAITT